MPRVKCTENIGSSTKNANRNDEELSRKANCSVFKDYLAVAVETNDDHSKSKALKNDNDAEAVATVAPVEQRSPDKNALRMKDLCEEINCPQINFQIEKLVNAQDQLMTLQQRDLFDQMFGRDFMCFGNKKAKGQTSKTKKMKPKTDEQFEYMGVNEAEKLGEEEEFICFASEIMELLPEQEWHGFFRGYDILSENNFYSLNDNKKCIEIGHLDTVEDMEVYLRGGARCFIIDLFKGNNERNQTIVVRFRQSELNIARELGFPITSTLFARLSPRLQYTGYLETTSDYLMLCESDCVMLTTDRYWAYRCSKCHIFVNARYLLPDVRCYDIILIGTKIQLLVSSIFEDCLRCKVIRGGKLYSRMPVLFNSRCRRFRISFCELEDITFVKEVGINVIVSDILGTKAYFDDLRGSLKLLHCDNIRIFARIVLNNIEDEETNVDWAVKAYDGFIGELSLFKDGCGGDGNITEVEEEDPSARILFLNQQMRKLVQSAHAVHKPFIFDPTPLVNGQYIMDPLCYKVVLYHPDKYLITSGDVYKNTTFYLLANALGASMPKTELEMLLPYCDKSHTGSDTLALATASASFELDASCIFVVGLTGRMAMKIASFRPKATIYFISGLKSVGNYISIHHNVVMLYYDTRIIEASHQKSVYTQFLFALSYALKLKNLKHGQHVIFVYGQNAGQLLLDKYVVYKFDERNFIRDLEKTLF